MWRFRLFIMAALVLFLVSCIQRVEQRPTSTSEVADLLRRMVEQDRKLRLIDTCDANVVAEANLNHREAVYDLLAKAKIEEPEELYLAALIVQNADPAVCPECFLLAHHLAGRAADLDHDRARYLAAATLDRYLVSSGKPQKFGTQFIVDSAGRYQLVPWDTSTSDSERALWDVPPLDSLQRFPVGTSAKK